QRKGFELSFILFGPGVLMAAASRGYPAVGTEGFAGNLGYNKQLKTLMDEGTKIYACRFAMGALYGMREDDLIEGVKAISPLDVLDANIQAWKERAIVVTTWTR
ncbi:MSMEG_0572/Sll0783 family nitrogen starvation response protein, partial [Paraburkholderia elongata]